MYIKFRKVEEYTLQKSYQLKENDIALKIILPVSMVHSAFYLVYLGVNNVLRHVFANSDAVFYVTLLEWMHIVRRLSVLLADLCVCNVLDGLCLHLSTIDRLLRVCASLRNGREPSCRRRGLADGGVL